MDTTTPDTADPADARESFGLTRAAADKIESLLIEDGSANALRVAITGGGCSGFQYALGLDHAEDIDEDEDVLIVHEFADQEQSAGMIMRSRIILDQTTLAMLKGGQLDYDDGIMGKGFSVDNPNATGTCGCGQSFDSPEAPCR